VGQLLLRSQAFGSRRAAGEKQGRAAAERSALRHKKFLVVIVLVISHSCK